MKFGIHVIWEPTVLTKSEILDQSDQWYGRYHMAPQTLRISANTGTVANL